MTPNQAHVRERLQRLLSIPEFERTDTEWNEIHDLELQLAPRFDEDAPEKPRMKRNAGQDRPTTPENSRVKPASEQGPVRKKPVSSFLRARKRNKRLERARKDS